MKAPRRQRVRGPSAMAEPAPTLAVKSFHHPATGSVSHVVADHQAHACAIVDPVLDFDSRSGRVRTDFADAIAAHIHQHDLQAAWILETDLHVDHLSAAQYLKKALGGGALVAAGVRVREMQKTLKYLFNLDDAFIPNGAHFDQLFADGDRFQVGAIELRTLHTPGHTAAAVSYVGEQVAFVGNTVYAPEFGTARTDFSWSNARALYRSIRRLYALRGDTQIFSCRDFHAGARPGRWQSSVLEQRTHNVLLRDEIAEDAFVQLREIQDRTLELPALLCPALQVNMRAGHLPDAEANGIVYFKLPVNVFR